MDDHDKLRELIGRLFEWREAGELDDHGVSGLLRHFIGAVAIDNEAEVKAWLYDPTVAERWKDGVKGA